MSKGKLIRTCTRDGCDCIDLYEPEPAPRGNPPTRIAARNNVKTRIAMERERQVVLWGEGTFEKDIRLAVLMEEVGERRRVN